MLNTRYSVNRKKHNRGPAPALYICGPGDLHSYRRVAGCAAHSHGHLPGDPHSGDQRGLAVQGLVAGPDGETHPVNLPARSDHHRQRHRALEAQSMNGFGIVKLFQ
jgi:hypothetical protein